jgi:hypothetical protein
MVVRVDETRMNDTATRIDDTRRPVAGVSVGIGSDPEYCVARNRYRSTIDQTSLVVQRHHDAVSNQNVAREKFWIFYHLLDRYSLFLGSSLVGRTTIGKGLTTSIRCRR